MRKVIEVRIPIHLQGNTEEIGRRALEKAGLTDVKVWWRISKKSIDARPKTPVYVVQVEVWDDENDAPEPVQLPVLKQIANARPVHIIGAGPAGYFAALELIALGYKPVVIERGKDVRARRRDLRAIQQFSKVNPDSNYCFGEGGAGTYSDGKLYTRAKKRGNVGYILQTLVDHGAVSDILIDAHPHIGSNKLPKIISNIRATIENHGGEVHFRHCLTDFSINSGAVEEISINAQDVWRVQAVILATGHSARDIYALVRDKGLKTEFKPFALGVRIEHPQALIDKIRYRQEVRDPDLPAASYQVACQVGGQGVFSFCMCPGGLIVPAATAPGEIVVNGMSLSRRDSPFANAGTVVAIDQHTILKYASAWQERPGDTPDSFAGLRLQRSVEESCFAAGDGSQKAPAQRLTDFLDGKTSGSLPDCSYIPGLFSVDLREVVPDPLVHTLRDGIREFDKKMPGYITEEAVVVATESRTSAPVRIPRNDSTLMHPQVQGLFPCGEGAGYAGGIISAALDGQRVARAAVDYLEAKTFRK